MKNRRILLIIGCILIAGVLITKYTNSFITNKETQITAVAGAAEETQEKDESTAAAAADQTADMERSLEEALAPGEPAGILAAAGSGAAEGAEGEGPSGRMLSESAVPGGHEAAQPGPGAVQKGPGSTSSGPGAVKEAVPGEGGAAVPQAAAIAEDQAVDESIAVYAQAAPGPVSPIEGVKGKNDQSQLISSSDYMQRLYDLDYQIQKLREEDKDATAYTLKNTAESELKLWESEMGNIYSALLEQLPQEKAVELAAEQQEWLKGRDVKAAEQNAKNNAVNLESVGYITSLATITRDRTYELAQRYEDLARGDSGT